MNKENKLFIFLMNYLHEWDSASQIVLNNYSHKNVGVHKLSLIIIPMHKCSRFS